MRTILGLLLVTLLAGCASAPPVSEQIPSGDRLAVTAREQRLDESRESATIPADPTAIDPNDRAIISSGKVRVETTNADSAHARAIAYACTHDGYVLSSRSGRTSIRVPAIHFNDALSEFEGYGRLIDKTVKSDEVTDQFFDLQTRLANAEKTRGRYLGLLDRATSIPEVLKLERELERINQLIETYKGKLNRLAHLTLHSTMTLSTQERTKAGPVGYALGQVVKGLKWLFVRN